MARRRKKTKILLGKELTALLLILIGIISFGLGTPGVYLKSIAILLVGKLWFLLPILLILRGGISVFSDKSLFDSSKIVSVGIITIFALTLIHIPVLKNLSTENNLIVETLNLIKDKTTEIEVNNIFSAGTPTIEVGSGLIGAIFLLAFSTAFTLTGTIIISIVSIIFGTILLFNINAIGLFKKILLIKLPKRTKKARPIKLDARGDLEVAETVVKPEKIIISNINEIKNISKIDSFESLKPESGPSSNYVLPEFNLLKESTAPAVKTKEDTKEKRDLEVILEEFGIKATVVGRNVGPAVTQYELNVPRGTKLNKISGLHKEIALALAAKSVRIEAPIPGKGTIGIEIPNKEITPVPIRSVLEATAKVSDKNKLYVALGKDIMGNAILGELTKMPHLLIAGSTGSGKSVAINSIIASLMMRYKPNEVKLVLIDPKRVELTNYKDIPYLLSPVVTDPKHASVILAKVVNEMENRYELFSQNEFKNIEAYNNSIEKKLKKDPNSKETKLPYIVVIIDELADLMLVAAREVEDSILRITQMARAAGIHLIVATQRPSTDVITGLIKNNIPSRIAFSVASNVDSRTILDMGGAEKLLGRGDMLFLPMGENTPKRIQGCYISDTEISELIKHSTDQQKAKYHEDMQQIQLSSDSGSRNSEGDEDPMYDEVLEFVTQEEKVSTSLIQRRFRFGYNRAARMIDLLESRGIIGPPNGSKPRDVLVKLEEE